MNIRFNLGRYWQRFADMFQDHCHGGIGFERHPPGNHFVQHDPQAIQVRALVDFDALRLLGADVIWGADDCIRLGEVRAAFKQFRDAEISQENIALCVNQHVRGLQVPVDYAMSVGITEGIRQLEE